MTFTRSKRWLEDGCNSNFSNLALITVHVISRIVLNWNVRSADVVLATVSRSLSYILDFSNHRLAPCLTNECCKCRVVAQPGVS